jgi:hypothetical protein
MPIGISARAMAGSNPDSPAMVASMAPGALWIGPVIWRAVGDGSKSPPRRTNGGSPTLVAPPRRRVGHGGLREVRRLGRAGGGDLGMNRRKHRQQV